MTKQDRGASPNVKLIQSGWSLISIGVKKIQIKLTFLQPSDRKHEIEL